MSSAELTPWARLDELDPGAVATALWQDRALVKTWAMRGTLHLLAVTPAVTQRPHQSPGPKRPVPES